jgi:uncharacterized protein YndB with AHSA1/START domain
MAPLTDEMATVWVRRVLSAPPPAVFAAWHDAELLQNWLVPRGLRVTRAEAYGRVGGWFRLWYADGEADVGGIEARFLAFEQNRRLVLRWGFCGPARIAGPIYESLLSVRIRSDGYDGTHVTLAHEGLEHLRAARPELAENVGRDWVHSLDQLESILEEGAHDGDRSRMD